MANTYSLISSNVLGSNTASVTFSAIPNTYTDLVLKISGRTTGTTAASILIAFNGSTANFSFTRVRGDGTTATTLAAATSSVGNQNISTTTASTFSNLEIYIPSYNSATNKPFSSFNVTENNATAANTEAYANLRSNTAAITSLTFTDSTAANFVTGSSFYLYGIKNS